MSLHQISRSSLYWRAWFGIVVLALLLRCTVFFGPWGGECSLGFAYVIATWLPIMVLFGVERHRLSVYVEQHHPQKWLDLTGEQSDGTFKFTGFTRPAWLSTSYPSGDPGLEQIKHDNQQVVLLGMSVFFSDIIMFPLLTYARTV